MTAKVTRRQLASLALGAAVGGTMTNARAQKAGVSGDAASVATLYDQSDATDLATLVRRRVVAPERLLDEAIARIERLNPRLNCVTLKHYELARDMLAKPVPGPLTGVPFLLKDLGVELAGTATTGGSKSLMGMDAPSDNEIVTRYKKTGLVILGKTNVPEFGMAFTTESTAYGACRNPWNPAHTTGGSSGGAAAAVAAGIVPVAHGTDGGGSIRVPAAACGVFGFKPTRLLTPRGPGGRLSPSAMSVGHVLSRSVRDSALLLRHTAGYEAGAPFAAPGDACAGAGAAQRPLRVALNLKEPAVALDPECRRAVLDMADTLRELGHVVDEAAAGVDYAAVNSAQTVLMLCEFSNAMHSLARYKNTSVDALGLEPLTLTFVRDGEKFSAADYIANCQACYAAGAKIAQLQTDYDVILQPVTATLPPKLGVINYQPGDTSTSFVDRFRKYAAYTYLYNLTGQPSAAVPAGLSESGLPIGVMLTGRSGEDFELLGLCAQIENARPWFDHRPAV